MTVLAQGMRMTTQKETMARMMATASTMKPRMKKAAAAFHTLL